MIKFVESDMTEAHDTVSRFRRDLREAQRAAVAPTYLINRAGTLAADVERLGADDRLISDARRLAADALALLKCR